MNFADVLIGSLVFSLASGSSLQLTAGMGRSLVEQRADRERMERIELELLAADQRLRQGAAQRPSPDPACVDPAGLMVALINSSQGSAPGPGALPTGLERQLEALGPREVRLVFRGASPALSRQRLFTPAAYGLCATGVTP
ncbi:hypothetical protein [Cyanobium sp. Morenito 9A2]|uniref:hypothetical protein n=1 Tax=Cyanobium sp. Morenito 9A2 TaxID=2823718 RepID=UPI0020CF6F7E|nr:hypothetical protein [Cyanobium sp. Morenito 9A2]MCP9848804.1 hypothetical protein [Cyanobium sp. Morenito 9A2]